MAQINRQPEICLNDAAVRKKESRKIKIRCLRVSFSSSLRLPIFLSAEQPWTPLDKACTCEVVTIQALLFDQSVSVFFEAAA